MNKEFTEIGKNVLKIRVQGTVSFLYYQDGYLFYKCSKDGFIFPVPLSDAGSARFPCDEKGMMFMRWIRKHMELIKSGGSENGK